MSSRYPILDNRPIDQWKVTELKEELKKRKLTTKGLKDDLIKRLNEALRIEREAAEAAEASEKDEANGFDRNPQLVAGVKDSKTVTVVTEVVNTIARENVETVETAEKKNIGTVEQVERENSEKIPEVVGNESTKTDNLNGVTVPVDVNNYVSALVGEVGHRDLPATVDSASVGEELVVHGSTAETSITITESVSTELVVSCQDSCSTEIQKENGDSETKLETENSKALLKIEDSKALLETDDSKALLETEDSKALLETEDSKALLETEDSKALLETEDSKALLETEDSKPQLKFDVKTGKDLVPESSIPENQVSEVNHSLRSQVKSDSISCDSVSINEKNEFKGNTIADNVKLEQDNIRPEMLEPSPSNFVPVYDESRSMDVGELHEKKEFVEENIKNITSPDFNKTNSSDDVGYPEKLNLDRSSGDDSMEEDLPESKQFDSKFNDDELREKSKGSEVPIVEESGAKAVGEGISSGKNDIHQDNDICPTVTTEKRKFHDQASVGNESAKRQRRWSSPQCTVPATTPKDESIALKCNFSRSDSLATDDAPRDRIVPPSQSSPTTSLRIDRFLRPFTLKAVQELLGKTGKVISFWMDHIKTHCYVTYSSVEEAVETRNTVYNLQWPPNGGRLLVAEFVDPQEVKMKVETPPIQAASVGSSPTAPSAPPISQPEPSPRQHREQPPFPATLPPPPPLSKLPPAVRERLPSPPPLPEKADPPIVTLDDLFRKTRATPRIYYLPLSEEQVAAKLAAQGPQVFALGRNCHGQWKVSGS